MRVIMPTTIKNTSEDTPTPAMGLGLSDGDCRRVWSITIVSAMDRVCA
jgi:hypothetical protein